MFVGNFKNYADMELKKKRQLELLRLMAENEEEKERRVRDFRNPYIPKPVPPTYKTAGERRADIVELERVAFQNLETLGNLSTIERLQIMSAIRESDESEGILKFNAFFPQIKSRLLRSMSPELLTANYLAKWITDYIRRSDTINPLQLDGSSEAKSSFADFFLVYPNFRTFADFGNEVLNFYNEILEVEGFDEEIEEELSQAYDRVFTDTDNDYEELEAYIPTQEELNDIREKGTIVELEEIANDLNDFYKNTKMLDNKVIATFTQKIQETSPTTSVPQLEDLAKQITRKLNGIKDIQVVASERAKLSQKIVEITSEENEREELFRQQEEYIADTGEGGKTTQETQTDFATGGAEESKGAEEVEGEVIDEEEEPVSPSKVGRFTDADIDSYVEEIIQEIKELPTMRQKLNNYLAIMRTMTLGYEEGKGKTSKTSPSRAIREALSDIDYERMKESKMEMLKLVDSYKSIEKIDDEDEREDELEELEKIVKPILVKARDLVRDILPTYMRAKNTIKNPTYNPRMNKLGALKTSTNNFSAYTLKQGFGVRNGKVLAKKGGSVMIRPAVMPNTYRRPTNQKERLAVREVEGELLRAKERKKKVGKGVAIVVPDDTYKQFGKHILHYPQLRDMNTLNIKYPSGTKNYVKKQVISDDYKDLVMDILERGKMSDGLYDRLSNDEKVHLAKIVKGAGLMEQLKVKTPKDDKLKIAMERFKLLRGQYLAGNNAPTMLEELKTHIVVLMEKQVISREDGLELLKEIS